MEAITTVGLELSSVHSQKGICITHKMKPVLKIRSFLKKNLVGGDRKSLFFLHFFFRCGKLCGNPAISITHCKLHAEPYYGYIPLHWNVGYLN